MKQWQGVPPCKHRAQWMAGARECAPCWVARMEREDAQTAATDEALPFDGTVNDSTWDSGIESAWPLVVID